MSASRVALVTGAGRGIGAALTRGMSEQGIAVGLLGRNSARLDAVAAGLQGARAVAAADVTDVDQVRRSVGELTAALGPVDLLVNNAGRIDPEEVPLGKADPAAMWAVVEANLRGPMHLCAAVLPGMLAGRGGRIVNVNSSFAYRRSGHYTGYAVSKGALARLTALLDHQYSGDGVRAFDVSPGAVATDMTADMAIFAGKTDWTPVSRIVSVVSAIAAGRLDALSGRFLHAGQDDVETLLAAADRIRHADARVVRLVPYGEDDPLGA